MTEAPAAPRLAPSPFLRDVLLSGATTAGIMVSMVLVTGWLAAALGPVAFGVYALSRRLVSAVGAIAPGPLGVALTRSVAMNPEPRQRYAYLWAGTLLALGPSLAILAAGIAGSAFWADLLLSDSRYAPELVSALGLALAMAVYSVVFSRLRGGREIARANRWQLWVMAAGPVIVVGLGAWRGQVALILVLLGGVALTAAVPLVGWLAAGVRTGVRWAAIREPLRALLRYGLPRVPGAAALAGLLAIGPFLAPYVGDVRQAGYFVAGQSVLRIVEASTAAFGLVALPRVSELQTAGRQEFLRDRVEDLVGFLLHLGLFAGLQLFIWAPEIVRVWLGREYAAATPMIRVLLVALVPYLAYTLLRSVIDGMEERPVNTLNLYAALGCTAVLSVGLAGAGLDGLGLAIASALGFLLLGALTFRFLRRSLGLRREHLGAGLVIASNLAAAGAALVIASNLAAAAAALALRSALAGRVGDGLALGLGFGAAACLLAGSVALLRHRQVRWVLEVEARLVSRRIGG